MQAAQKSLYFATSDIACLSFNLLTELVVSDQAAGETPASCAAVASV